MHAPDFTMQWYDYVRCVTAFFSIFSMYCLGRIRIRGYMDQTNRIMNDFWWSLNAILFCMGVGSLEQIVRDREATWTLPLSLVAVFVFFRSIRATRKLKDIETGRATG